MVDTYIYESDEEFTPSEPDRAYLVDQITLNYKNWDRDRAGQREQWLKVKEALFLDITHNNRNNDETVLLPQIHEQVQTLESTMMKSNFQNLDMMFIVEGEDAESQANASIQKANLKNKLRKMGFLKEAHRCIQNYVRMGEMISFTHWVTEIDKVRRKVDVQEDVIHPFTGESLGVQTVRKTQIVPRIKYEGVKVKSVDPLSFVFDKNEVLNWDSCNKIHYSLSSPYDIVANEQFNLLKKDEKDALLAIFNSNQEDLTTDKYHMETVGGVRGDQVAILECWGDIKLENGKVLRNYVATIVADQYLARLEPNPYVRNPFTIAQYMQDPDSKRGRSMVLVAVPINQVSSQILNGQIRGLRMALNPPILAPNDFFTQNRIDLFPGKIVGYDDLYNGARPPQPYSFKDGLVGFEFLNLMETKIEASTGAFKYMAGNQDNKTRTATETSALVTGQNTRMSMTITTINEDWTIPTLENIAEIDANMNYDNEDIKTGMNAGVPTFETVTPEVRQGNYSYFYGDSQSIVEMEAKMTKITNMLAPFAGKAQINWDGFLKLMFSKLNIENADVILTQDPIDAALAQMFPQVKPEQMEVMKKQFVDSGMFQQIAGQVLQQMQGGMQQGAQGGQGTMPQNVGAQQQPPIPGA